MKHIDTGAALGVLVLLAAVIVFAHQCACTPAGQAHTQNVVIAGSYAAQLEACVDNAHTLAESQACRCEVSKRNSRPCDVQDAGGDAWTK